MAAESQDCDCDPGDSPVGGPPDVKVGNPIAVDSGTKIAKETDYRSADGLLTVDREFKNRARNPQYVLTPLEIPGFAAQWHGLLPGVIDVEGDQSTLFAYLSSSGQVRRFFALGSDLYEFTAYDQTRLKMSMVATPTDDRATFFQGSADTASSGELRLQFANGDYILFRRAGTYDAANQRRLLVPVEQGKANGYKQWFDYPDAGIYPNQLRDSFGRQLSLTWAELGWSHNVVRGAHKGPNQATAPSGFTQESGISAIGLPDGTSLNYTYGSSDPSGYLGQLAGVTRKDASGTVLWGRSYLYEDTRFPAAITGILDQNGNRLSTYAYDDQGRATSTERAGGVDKHQVAYSTAVSDTFPNEGQPLDVRSVTNPLGLVTEYKYSAFSTSSEGDGPPADRTPRRLLSVEVKPTANVANSLSQINYSDQGQVAGFSDPNGNETGVETNDDTLLPDSVTDAKNVTRPITWHPTLDLPTQITLPGRLVVNFTYDTAGQILTRSEVDKTSANFGTTRTTTYTWASGSRLLSINGPRNPAQHDGQDDVTAFTYDAQGNRSTMTNAVGHVTSYANYDANGNPGEMTDPNGIKTAFTYDSLGRLKTVTVKHPSDSTQDAVTTLDYDVEGRVVGLTRPDTAKLNFDYDLAGRLLAMRSDDGERIDYTYDAMNDVLSETVKRVDGTQSRATARTFDELGRILSEALGPDRVTHWAYDKNGNATQVTAPRGNATTQAFDQLDRLVSVVAPAAGTTTTAYDSQDNPTSFHDANSVTTTFTRNGFGDVVQEISPDRGTAAYVYDDGGDLASMTDGRGQQITFIRDILGRITRKVPVGHTDQAVNYDWDQPDTETTYRIGRLTRIRDETGTTIFSYDHRGNLTAQRQKLVGTADWVWLRYAYDLGNRVVRITYPSGRQVRYDRDTKGRVQSVKTRADSTAAWTDLALGIQYEPFGPIASMRLGNGLKAVNDWGDDGRLAMRRLFRISDGTNLSRLTYDYDADDNITRINDTVDPTRNQKFVYDAAGRVSRIDGASGSIQRTNYTYDDNGNRLREHRRALATDPDPLETDVYTYQSGTNRLTRVKLPAGNRNVAYDGRGNTGSETRPGSVSVTTSYDGYGRLTAYNRSNTDALSFTYNGRDDRVAMVRGVETRRFVYDPDGRVMGEYGNSAADVKAEFIWLSPEVANDNEFGGGDGIGGYAPLAVATPDLTGAVQVNWVHGGHLGVPLVTTDVGGNQATTPNDYLAPGFPGQSRVLADLYYNRYRDFDPSTGRYVQADPVGLVGGSNPYLYAGGNPTSLIDPYGLDTAVAIGGGISSNPFGHAAIAFSGAGVCSYGTGTPLGGSFESYLRSQNYRNTTVYIIPTTPQQEAAMKAKCDSYKDKALPNPYDDPIAALLDNCSTRVIESLAAGGITDNDPVLGGMFPESARAVAMRNGGVPHHVRGGQPLPPWVREFNPR